MYHCNSSNQKMGTSCGTICVLLSFVRGLVSQAQARSNAANPSAWGGGTGLAAPVWDSEPTELGLISNDAKIDTSLIPYAEPLLFALESVDKGCHSCIIASKMPRR